MTAGAAPRPVIVVMGVSGSGKSTVGGLLAERLGVPYAEADDFHPAANVAKMSAGQPLDDADRAPWLDAVAEVIGGWVAAGTGGVTACSALRRAYRDRLRAADPGLVTVYLELDEAALARRLAGRRGHYFAPQLLASQLATLEPPDADEGAIRVDGALPVADAVEAVLASFSDRAK